jgi:hypothetical protein
VLWGYKGLKSINDRRDYLLISKSGCAFNTSMS